MQTFVIPTISCHSTLQLFSYIIVTGENVQNASSSLRYGYEANRFTVEKHDWPPYRPKHYTTLALIHHKGKPIDTKVISVTSQLAAEGNLTSEKSMDSRTKFVYSNTTNNISDFFTSQQNSDTSTFRSYVILIEGAPGIGKTVLSKEIAYQWAKNNVLGSRKLLLLIALRNFKSSNIISIEDFLPHILKSSQMATSVAKYVNANNGEDLAMVLDGYDELTEQDRQNSFIVDIIYRRILPKCLLVITSRPTASLHLHNLIDCRIEIVGFTEENRLGYIRNVLPNSHEEIIQYLQSNPTINALCYIPLNMTILLCLVENDINNLPKSQTELYRDFIKMTIRRHLTKNNQSSAGITGLFDLPPECSQLFKELAHFAFKALKHDQLVFTLQEIKEVCPNLTNTSSNWNGLGLLNSIESFEKVTYHFLHFSIQEYMAAYYISTLSNQRQIDFLKNTFWNVRYYNTWIMYVGITGGNSFALRHFFSGHYFRLSTRLFGISAISKNLLKDKIKCLHMFQCLAETQDDKVISLIGNLFQDKIIDLSNQTLLPRDLTTLAFFLVRSFNKSWKKLNLSNCNIGSDRSKILLDTLSGKSCHNIVNINSVDLSYNQLNFLSLVGLFDLLTSWHTTELIIIDDSILETTSSAQLFASLENTFIYSESKMEKTYLKTFSVGSFLFAYNIDEQFKLSTAISFKQSIYLLSCTCSSGGIALFNLFHPGTAVNFHLLDTHINRSSIEKLTKMISSHEKFGSLFIYDSTLSDEVADGIGNQILLSNNSANIMLVASKYKLQGVLNTCSLSSELSDLEMFNLIVKVRSSCCNYAISVPSWNNSLCFHGNRSKTIVWSFSDMVLNVKSFNCQLKLKIIENDTVIAQKVRFEDIIKDMPSTLTLRAVYLSCCELNDTEYETLFTRFGIGSVSILYIFYSSLSIEKMCNMLQRNCCTLQELFCHTNCIIKDNIVVSLSFPPKCSVVLASNNNIVVHNPTNKQVALVCQLKPSANVWRFLTWKMSAETFYMILHTLAHTIKTLNWVELDFIECNLTLLECRIIHDYFSILKFIPKIKKLYLSGSTNPLSITSSLAEIIRRWEIEQLIVSDKNSYIFYDHLVEDLRREIFSYKSSKQVCLTVSYSDQKVCFCYNIEWRVVTATLDNAVTTLFLVNCQLFNLSENEIVSIESKLPMVSKLFIIHCSLLERNVVCLLKAIICKEFELFVIDNIAIDGENLYNLVTDITVFHSARTHFVAVMDNFFCGYGTTEYQLHLLKSMGYSFNDEEHKIIRMASKMKLKIIKDLFLFHNHQLKALYFIANKCKEIDAMEILFTINDTSFIKIFGLENCAITNDKIKYIFIDNAGIEEFCISGTFYYQIQYLGNGNDHLGDKDTAKLIKALHDGGSQQLRLENNNVIEAAADNLSAVLSHNTDLTVLNLSNNNLQSAGVIKIAQSLQNVNTLQELWLTNINATEEAADDIAAVLSHNTNLTELNLNGNNLQSAGVIKIAQSLQNVNTLQGLGLGNINATEEAADDIAAVLSHNTNLTVLDLDGNNLQSAGVIKIAQSLQNVNTLQGLGLGNINATEEAADDIAAVLSHNTNLTELNLNGNDLQSAGVIKIAQSLQNVNTLKRLGLGNINATEEAADDIAAVLSHNTNLTELNLNGNNLQSAGVIKIAQSLQNVNTLQGLGLGNINATEEAADDIAAVLSHNTNLTLLDLNGNNLQSAGVIKIAQSLKSVTTLHKLWLANINATEEAADDIAAVLSHNTNLTELDLDGNNLQSAGVIKIAQSLQNVNTLQKLWLTNINATEEAADDIAAVLSHNTNLTVLHLNGNNLQSAGVIKIAQSLQNVNTLQELWLANINATEEAADDIAAVLSHNTNLTLLDLNGNNLQSASVIKIAQSLQNVNTLQGLGLGNINATEEAADDIAAVLSHNTNLTLLDLNGNNLQSAGVIKIAQSLKSVTTLQKLWLANINATEEAADDIAAVLSHNTNLTELNLNGNNLQSAGVIKIAQSLHNVNTLQKLWLTNINATEEAADDIAAVLSHNTNLTVLHLNGNNLQSAGVIKIAQSLQNVNTLQGLGLGNINATEEAADEIAAVLSHNTNLTELNLNGNNLQSAGVIKIAQSLKSVTTLQKLWLAKFNATEEAADDIAAVLSHNTNLTVLDLDGNNLQSAGVIKIAQSLQNVNTLQKLWLTNINATEEAADDIAAVLSHNTNLTELNLNGNNLQSAGVIKIAQSLQNVNTLQGLGLGNINATEEAADDIAAVLSHNTNLTVLDLNGNNLQSAGVIKIAQNLQNVNTLQALGLGNVNATEEAVDDIAAVLSHNTNLTELNLDGNNLQSAGVIKIALSLKSVTTLQKLWLANNNATEEVADDIAAVLSHNANLTVLDLK